MKQAHSPTKRTILTIVSGVLTGAICLVMNLWLMPAIERTTEGIRCFDMNFGYDFETAKRFLSLLDERGRDLYLHAQLPLDFFYPVCYTVFFLCMFAILWQGAKWLAALPACLAVLDYTENVLTIVMLKSQTLSKPLATAASAVTSAKTILMYLIFALLIAGLIRYLVQKKKAK